MDRAHADHRRAERVPRAVSLDAARSRDIAHDYNYAQVLTLDLVAQGFRYAEVPITYRFRDAGRSFVKLGTYLRRVLPAVLRVVEQAHERRATGHAELPPRRLLGTAAAAVALAFAALAFASLAARATIPLDGSKPIALTLAVLLAAAGMTGLAWPWRDVMVAVGAPPLARTRTIAAYFAGEVGKYVPGAVWPVIGRAERARRLGVEVAPAYAGVVLSLGLAYLAAGVVFGLGLPVALVGGSDALDAAWALVVVPAGIVLLHPTRARRRAALRGAGRATTGAVHTPGVGRVDPARRVVSPGVGAHRRVPRPSWAPCSHPAPTPRSCSPPQWGVGSSASS